VSSVRDVADAVLYEGYVLYPYRASADKNRVRFQWGVLMPADAVARATSERQRATVGLVVEGRPVLTVTVRFLQLQERVVEQVSGEGFTPVDRLRVGATTWTGWDEGVEQERSLPVDLTGRGGGRLETYAVAGGRDVEELRDDTGTLVGRLVRTRRPLRFELDVRVQRPSSPYGVSLVELEVVNRTADEEREGTRSEWLRRALVAAHLVAELDQGAFVSTVDPPEWARGYVEACPHDGLYAVLAGEPGDRRTVLCSPIILYDHPQLAAESESSFFDALEVDELLSLRTLTLSDAEKEEMRGTDPRAAALLDQVEAMPPDLWDRLHGTIRYVDAMTAPEPAAPDVPWWDPGRDSSVDPETDTVDIGGVDVGRGSRVILRPGARRADALDLFLAGREATVAAVLHDVDDRQHLAVTVDDDPGAELKQAHGRYLYFAPDEVEPLAGEAR
jgi:hypothetical protein